MQVFAPAKGRVPRRPEWSPHDAHIPGPRAPARVSTLQTEPACIGSVRAVADQLCDLGGGEFR